MNDNYMETLAKAYNEKLRGSGDPAVTAAAAIAEEQLLILETLNPARRKLVSYLRSLKQSVYSALSALAGAGKIPSYRSWQPQGGLGRILELEIELFVALDTLRADTGNADYDKLISTETRFTALLGNLR